MGSTKTLRVPCKYHYVKYYDNILHYICTIENFLVEEQDEWKPQGKHLDFETNQQVTALVLFGKSLTKVPRGLLTIFPKLQALEIRKSGLSNLTKKDLAEYKNLKIILFEVNSIEFIPGNLFEGFENLEQIWFISCNLMLIEPFILDNLKNLQHVGFTNNPNYHIRYSINPNSLTVSLDELKNELFRKYFASYPHSHGSSQTMNPHTISSDMKNLLLNEKFKDFKIKIGDREFLVHKFLLAARSSVLAELIHKNPNVENLNLVDISVETFEQVLHFIYHDELPGEKDGINFLHLFAAAGRLNIELLKDVAAANIFDQIDAENASVILKLSNRYEHDFLRRKVFGDIKKMYPTMTFKDEWASKADFLSEFIEIQKAKELALAKFAEEYQKLLDKHENLH